MKRQLETSSVPEQFESYKRLKVNPDLLIPIYFNVGSFSRVAVNLTRSSTVKDLKHALQYRTGLTLDGHVLKHGGRTLKDKEPVESLAEQVVDVVQAHPTEVYHLEWETEPESEHEESSFAPSDHSADSHHYPHPQTVNIADELARCQGNIDPQFVEVLFYNREDTSFKQWILLNIHALIDAFAILQDVYAVDHLSEIISDAIKSPILSEREHVLQRWIAALFMELDVLREYKSPCTFKLIKYFAVLASFTASQTWISQGLMEVSIQAIIKAAKSDIILDNGSMINLIKDMRERLSAEQLSDWRQKWVTETYHFLHTSDWRMRTQSHELSWIDFVLFADVALAPIESEKYYHWLLNAPHSMHSHFIPSIQFGIQIMKLLSENKNKRATWIRILSIMLEFYAQYQYISQSQVQLSAHENISKFVSVMEANQIEICGNKKISDDIMDMIIRKHPRSLDHAPMDAINLLTSLSADVMQFLETKSSKLTSLHIRMPHYSVCCASTSKLSRFNNIQKLSLCMPSLNNSDFSSIITQMGPQLTHLELQGAEELRKCFSVISSCKKMKKLNLAQTNITYSELLDVTDSCQELEELNISECWALNEDRLVLAELFQDGLQQLRVLDASGLEVQKDFQFMANQGYYLPNVRELTINNTLVDPHHILRVFPNLEVLESAHGPDMKDAVVAEATFDYNSTNNLKSVNIASKGFSNFCKYLDCLSFSYGLEKLNLSNCPWITRNNMIMRLPTSIKELDISNCGIDQTHVIQICQRLKNLERLNISRNGGMNGRRVIDLLANCPRLTSIDVSFCFAVDVQEVVGSRTARDILAKKVGFEFHVDGCSWTKESIVAFSIIYPTVQLFAGNHIYVEAAKEFLARINIPNIAM